MKRADTQWSGVLTGTLLLCVLPPAGHAQSAEFQVDPERSSVKVAGPMRAWPLQLPMQEQAPGSLALKLGGTLAVEVTDASMRFVEGSVVRFEDNGSWEPKANGEPGNEAACFGGKASTIYATAVAAGRHMELTLASQVLSLANGTFDADAVLVSFPVGGAAAFDYQVTGLLSYEVRVPLEGIAPNAPNGSATLVTEGSQQILTLPLDATYVFGLVDGETTLRIEGRLVATRELADAPKGFGGWIAGFFPGQTDETIVGPEGNPDLDPWLNVVEFAFGLDPTRPEPQFAPLQASPDPSRPGGWILEYERPKGLEGVGYPLFSGDSLGGWEPFEAVSETTDLENDRERVRIELGPPAAGASRQFVKLLVQSQ